MLQAQPSTLPTLTKGQNSALKNLTIMGYLEDTSFLLLLGIAMPLKYMMGIPEAVKYIGMAHGAWSIVYRLYFDAVDCNQQNKNAAMGNACRCARLIFTIWSVYI